MFSFFLLSFSYVLLSSVCQALGFVSFSTYCNNGTNPEVFPTYGKNSSGVFSMSKHELFDTYEPGMNCSVTLSVPDGFQLLVSFSHISLRNNSLDNLIVSSGEVEIGRLSGEHKCELENCAHLMFDSEKNSSNLTFHFISANISIPTSLTGFKAVYTVFDTTVGKKGRCKGDSRFLCVNSRCIANALMCDGHNNCGDRSDEEICIIPTKNTVWAIVVITIAVFSVLICVPIICYLATHGTKNIVKSVTVPSHAVPLYSAVNDNERTNLLSSSGGRTYADYWSSRSYEQSEPHAYGTSSIPFDSHPSTSDHRDQVLLS